MKHVLLILISAMMLANCKKPDAPDCFQPLGEIMDFPIEFEEEIHQLMLEDDVKVVLQNTSENESSFLRCHEFLESDISLAVENHVLVVKNNNTCNWVRKAPEITLFIHSDQLSKVVNNGTKGIDLINYSVPNFKLDQWQSLSTNHLEVHTDTLVINMHVLSGSTILSGTADHAQLYANARTEISDNGFTCQTASVNNSSQRDIYISAQEFLFGFIGNQGNIYYNHEDISLTISIEGEGNVLFQDF